MIRSVSRTATSGQRARRLEPDQRREQILACAVQLFGERPYSAVSTTELAKLAGVTRGLVHHYFGTKRGFYLEVVRRMVLLPHLDDAVASSGPLLSRVERSVDWFLGSVAEHGTTFGAVIGAEGVGDDPEIEQLLADTDDIAAKKVLAIVGVATSAESNSRERAIIRAYGGLAKGAVREWVRGGTLTRDEVRLLMISSLVTIVREVLPGMPAAAADRPDRSPAAAHQR